MKIKFEKEENNNWYVVLPEWEGSKEELQMVMGADIMLDIIAKTNNTVELEITLEPEEGYNYLKLIDDYTNTIGGGIYLLQYFEDKEINLDMWLCSVIVYVFGFLPEDIYFKRV